LGATALAAGVVGHPQVRGAESAKSVRRLAVGFLGTGYSHFAAKYQLLRNSPDYTVVGLCEEEDSVRAQGPTDARWWTAAELFRSAEVIVVESAVRNHAPDARRALAAGCHVHVEKPPADSQRALQELLALAANQKQLLQIGYMWRYHPGLNAVLTAAREGWLGEVYLVRALINTQGDAVRRREWAEFRGGVLFELGCHLIDPVIRLLGAPKRVQSTLQQTKLPPDSLMDNAVITFEFSRALAVVTCSAIQSGAGPYRSFEVWGTQGVARVQPLEPPGLVVDLMRAAGPYAQGRQEISLPPYRRYEAEFVALAAAIRTGQPLPVSAADELAVQSALMQACAM